MSLRLRQYKPCDGDIIAGWIRDERALRRWSSDRFPAFPITGADINEKYIGKNGDCVEPDNFYPFTAFDSGGAVGHLIMRYVDSKKDTVRFGFVIVDDSKRGKGLGKELLYLSLKYAFEILKAKKVTLGVFDDNVSAYRCYRSVGFKETGEERTCGITGEQWKIIEMEITAEDHRICTPAFG